MAASVGLNTDAASAIHAELVKTRRSLGPSSGANARDIPAVTVGDMLAAAVLLTPGCIRAIERVSTGYELAGLKILNVKLITNGEPNAEAILAAVVDEPYGGNGTASIGVRQYLGGWPVNGDGAVRSLAKDVGEAYTVSRYGFADTLAFLRSTMRAWQRLTNSIGAGMLAYGFAAPMGKDEATEFFLALFSLASSLDVLGETTDINPTTVKEAFAAAWAETKAALATAAEVGGKAVGELANVAGNVAGQAVKGFFEGANIATLAIAGFLVYIGARHYGWI